MSVSLEPGWLAGARMMYSYLYTLPTGMHMRETTFTHLRNHAKSYFDLVEAGETVRVLRNGKPIAEIHPIETPLPSWKRRKPRPLAIGGEEISRLILEERGD